MNFGLCKLLARELQERLALCPDPHVRDAIASVAMYDAWADGRSAGWRELETRLRKARPAERTRPAWRLAPGGRRLRLAIDPNPSGFGWTIIDEMGQPIARGPDATRAFGKELFHDLTTRKTPPRPKRTALRGHRSPR